MKYKLVITDHADELLDGIMYYLLHLFKSEQAAKHLVDELEKIYTRLEENPYQFPICKNSILKRKGYREVVLSNMNYLLIFRIQNRTVYLLGIFHCLENYQNKL